MSETLTDPLLGRLIDGRYEVRDRVAAGGMATVYLAFDKRLERDVALKVMHRTLADNADENEFVSRFRREAKAAARLTHPGMVRVYDQGVDGDLSYLTMEYVNGENLRQRLAHEATLPLGEAMAIGESVLDALAAAHRQGLVHRDVKPENVLIDEDGRPRLADFGLARAVTEVTSTATGTIMGTVAYLSPELVSRGEADARTDLYAVGILLYEMVTGRQPFTAPSAVEVASRHVHEDVPPPSAHVPWLPPEFDELVARLSARDPDGRPADAGAALTSLRQTRAMVDDPTLARRADPPSGSLPVVVDDDETTVLDPAPSGSTVSLPIGLGEPLADLATYDAEIIDDDPEADDPDQRGNRALWWIGAIAAAVLMLTSLGLWWYNSIGPGAYTTVPAVAGESEAAARGILEAAGFEVTAIRAYDDAVTEGFVIETDPAELSRVLKSDEITLVVSRGPRMEEVPDVVGILESDAVDQLSAAGFPLGDVTRVYDDEVPEGEVMETTPTPGETVRHDRAIDMVVSNGPQPIQMPDVIGDTEETALGILEVYALDVTTVYERTLDQEAGRVFRQDPEPGADGVRTQEVTIYVSEGPPLVTVPDLSQQFINVNTAQRRLEELGFVVVRDDQPFLLGNDVKGQNPRGGTEAEYGSTVTLIY